MPAIVARPGSGTIVSPCEPSVIASTSGGATPASRARKNRRRAESSPPAMPITRLGGKPDTRQARCVISSSGFVTTIRIANGDAAVAASTQLRTTAALTSSRSIRLMPGLRGRPAVITITSELAVSVVVRRCP